MALFTDIYSKAQRDVRIDIPSRGEVHQRSPPDHDVQSTLKAAEIGSIVVLGFIFV